MGLPVQATRENLAEADPAVLADIRELALRQLSREEAILTALDGKAAAILALGGLTMTFACSFGGWPLFDHLRGMPSSSRLAVALLLIFFSATFVTGLVTTGSAVQALRVRGVVVLDDREILNKDAVACNAQVYRAQIATHIWYVVVHHYHLNQDKADWVFTAQISFVWFLVWLARVSFVVAFAV